MALTIVRATDIKHFGCEAPEDGAPLAKAAEIKKCTSANSRVQHPPETSYPQGSGDNSVDVM